MATGNESSSSRVVHEIQWSEALPWWLLFRGAGAAFSPSVILLAALGALATWAGWSVADSLGLAGGATAAEVAMEMPATSPAPGLSPSAHAVPAVRAAANLLPTTGGDVLRLVALPFSPAATLRDAGGALARIGWFVLVWSIFGTAIARHVALSLVGEETPGLIGGLRYGSQHWLSAFNSVVFVLIGILALSIPGALLGLLMRTDIGLALAGVIWPLVLAGAVVLAILAIGVVAAWPLMVATVGVERGDSSRRSPPPSPTSISGRSMCPFMRLWRSWWRSPPSPRPACWPTPPARSPCGLPVLAWGTTAQPPSSTVCRPAPRPAGAASRGA